MKDMTKTPGRGGKTTVGICSGDECHAELHGGEIPLPTLQDQAWKFTTARPWPFNPNDSTPVTWWRKLPAHAFCEQERVQISETLRHVDVLHGGDELRAALNGDVAAAIATALALMPIENIDFHTDITMTSLLRCALNGEAAAALVLAQIVGLTNLGHALTRELSVSWIGGVPALRRTHEIRRSRRRGFVGVEGARVRSEG
ncbi:hypothetical protein QA641_32350 [Bradyrhizobium sp. CB1650]|uniref:hypothetical protein n=1 Tax=Bradyrhizobium sp. CB1650 TaxID=3039153 RepID=UPI0024355F3E|nr:hypothetical protein [Bradyrhizobium sp. CB1650]WGD50265.1 hypothetical protein QA641_32350 [Bradyrhizobium sp. CB1650]